MGHDGPHPPAPCRNVHAQVQHDSFNSVKANKPLMKSRNSGRSSEDHRKFTEMMSLRWFHLLRFANAWAVNWWAWAPKHITHVSMDSVDVSSWLLWKYHGAPDINTKNTLLRRLASLGKGDKLYLNLACSKPARVFPITKNWNQLHRLKTQPPTKDVGKNLGRIPFYPTHLPVSMLRLRPVQNAPAAHLCSRM